MSSQKYPQLSTHSEDWRKNMLYRNKYKVIKKIIKDTVFENAAVCDEISHIQEKLLIVREECKFLIKKMKQFEPQFDLEAVNIESNAIKRTPVRKKSNLNGVTKSKRPNSKKKKNSEELGTPMSIGSVTVLNFGQIVYDTPFYHTDCAVYPADYYATRIYAHYRNINSKCVYHCRITKAGTSPRFEIIDQEKNFKVTGLSSDECHSHLISLINKLLGTDDLIPSNNNGDLFFGLTLPKVRFHLQKNNEIKFCKGYVSLSQQSDDNSDNSIENDPSVSYDGLQAYLKKFHTR